MVKLTGIIGCISAALAIALGAFGAHALEELLAETGTTDVWRTAVDYHMWHALALVLCGVMPAQGIEKRIAAGLFVAGMLFFSGSLYWLALGGPRWLGPVTPLGGLSLMAGWISLAAYYIRHPGSTK